MINMQSATILTKTEVSDGIGGYTTTWAEGDSLAGTLQPLSTSEQLAYGSVYGTSTHNFFTKRTTDAGVENRLIIDGTTYSIEGVKDPGLRGKDKTLILKLVVPGD